MIMNLDQVDITRLVEMVMYPGQVDVHRLVEMNTTKKDDDSLMSV